MSSPPSQATDLTTLTLDAVRALLREIARDPKGYPGNGSAGIEGTNASFAAQALHNLIECEPLALIVMDAVQKER